MTTRTSRQEGPSVVTNVQLRGKTALVTGESSEIGRACAVRFARDGASLILTARDRVASEERAAKAGNGTIIEADLGNPEDLSRFCDRILDGTLAVDVLVHSAGVGMCAPRTRSIPTVRCN